LQELIQNADDAGATEVRFLVDSRQHPRDGLPNEHFKKYQGPALYAWNDAYFKREDWDCLAKIERSDKEKEVLKVGRFGLGFLSVFHVTGKCVCFLLYSHYCAWMVFNTNTDLYIHEIWTI